MVCRVLVLLLTWVAFLSAGSVAAAPVDGWIWPVRGDVLTGYRNGEDPYASGQHRGVDIAAPIGTPVVAATAGTVRHAGTAGLSGVTVSIRTAQGSLDTSYLHLASAAVKEGDRVLAGQRIGAVGTTGKRSAEPAHLHFGVREAGSRHAYRDPLAFLPPLGASPPRDPVPAPAPVPKPVPAAPRPAPAPAVVPEPDTAPRRVPAGRRVRAPDTGRVRAPVPGLASAPAPLSTPDSLPETGPGPAEQLGRAPAGVADAIAKGTGSPAQVAAPSTSAPAPAVAGRPDPSVASGGPDLGWALACVGLLLAAACLGRPGSGGRSGSLRAAVVNRGSALARALARPRLGGR